MSALIFFFGATAGFTLGCIATSAFACWMFDHGRKAPYQ